MSPQAPEDRGVGEGASFLAKPVRAFSFWSTRHEGTVAMTTDFLGSVCVFSPCPLLLPRLPPVSEGWLSVTSQILLPRDTWGKRGVIQGETEWVLSAALGCDGLFTRAVCPSTHRTPVVGYS